MPEDEAATKASRDAIIAAALEATRIPLDVWPRQQRQLDPDIGERSLVECKALLLAGRPRGSKKRAEAVAEPAKPVVVEPLPVDPTIAPP